MSSIETTDIPAAVRATPASSEERRRGTAAAFVDLFAQFAQQASLGTARNGSMSLSIGGAASQLPAAQTPREPSAVDAQPQPDLRDRAARAGHDRTSQSRSPAPDSLRSREPSGSGAAGQRSGAGRVSEGAPAPGRDDGATGGPGSGGSGQPARTGGSESQSPVIGSVAASAAVGARQRAAGITQVQGVSGVSRAAAGQPTGAGIGAGPTLQRLAQATPGSRPESAPSNPRPNQAFRSQLASGLGAALRQGRGEVTLRLRPHSLGELQVKLHIREGAVDAVIKPSTAAAHRLLEQSVDALRHSFEARGLQPGRIEIQPPPEGREAHQGGGQHADAQGQEGRAGTEAEGRSPEESAGGRRTAAAGGGPRGEGEDEPAVRQEPGGPGIVYGVADGAARIVMIDALA